MNDPTPAPPIPALDFRPDEEFARRLDTEDPLATYRDLFLLPRQPDGKPVIYFCGNSLGLQPRSARSLVEQELDDWADLGVGGHFRARTPWYSYAEGLRAAGARLAGALPEEVVMMNSLTVNLHLMMATFYRPTPGRHKILMEDCAFPSDTCAVQSQIRLHGFDPADALLVARPGQGEHLIRTAEIEALLETSGGEIALVLLGGVNYFTGQAFEIPRITAAAKRRGCVVGLDLAHAIGNIPLALHDWGVDFAVWCSYKYLNGGPGAVGGCFVHRTHGRDTALPRLAGWWGNPPATRFKMHLENDFVPKEGADGWQISNPPILSMAPLKAALKIFDEAGMEVLRAKSEKLTGYLVFWLDQFAGEGLELITPRDPSARGCQVSVRVARPLETLRSLEAAGVRADFREPDVIRIAPVPLYNTFHEVWRLGRILAGTAGVRPADL